MVRPKTEPNQIENKPSRHTAVVQVWILNGFVIHEQNSCKGKKTFGFIKLFILLTAGSSGFFFFLLVGHKIESFL
jgi:hypothetical protein